MKQMLQNRILMSSICFVFIMQCITIFNTSIFWYLYTFTLLICIAIALTQTSFFDKMPTWHYLIFGIGYGTITYCIVRGGYELLQRINPTINHVVSDFLKIYGPSTIWHYTILVLIIVVGEEMFWHGYVQQQLKKYMPPLQAIVIAALLFSISLLILGFIPGAFAALLAGIIFGSLYEWKRSLPLIIIAHAVFIILLFLVLPLPV